MNRRTSPPAAARHFAVVGAGLAGLACARTLRQAGHRVSVFEAGAAPGGRMASIDTPFGSFDVGAQYFTVRDRRFELALRSTAAHLARPWSATAVRVLDDRGRVVEAALPAREPHWVGVPDMAALPGRWAEPLAAEGALHLGTPVVGMAAERGRWRLQTAPAASPAAALGFDAVLLALTPSAARALLNASGSAPALGAALAAVDMAPCWNLSLAFPQAAQAGPQTLGPQWNAARSTHHRVAWLARESSKPGRTPIERWTVQASADWSREHARDEPARAAAKLLRAFAEVTGIRAEPSWSEARLWTDARTLRPLGSSYSWEPALGLGLCGDWCLGHRAEDAFVSGLELALAVLAP